MDNNHRINQKQEKTNANAVSHTTLSKVLSNMRISQAKITHNLTTCMRLSSSNSKLTRTITWPIINEAKKVNKSPPPPYIATENISHTTLIIVNSYKGLKYHA